VFNKLNRHVQMMVAERGMNNLDKESRVIGLQEAGSKDEVKHVGRIRVT